MQSQKIYEDFSNSEIAKEIIMNSLNEILNIHNDVGVRTELEDISYEYNLTKAKQVREIIKTFAQKTFNKFHTAKFDMSGHPILNQLDK